MRHSWARRCGTLLLAVAAVMAFALVPGRAPAAPGADTPQVNLPVQSYTLPNGLRVVLSRDPHVATVSTNIWYHVGSANEEPDQAGWAHLSEHMMYQGSGHIPHGKLDQLIEGTGAIYNGSTSFDRINFVIGDLPADRLELALWAESDRMGFVVDALTPTTLYNQQQVVRNERRQTHEQRPYALSDEEIYHQLFPESHPYHGAVMGPHAVIQSATPERMRDFFHRYYTPNNATLVVAGNFDANRAKGWIAKYFGSLARGPEATPPNIPVPHITVEKRITLTDKVDLQRVKMGWLTPAAFAPGDAAGDITAQILAGGESSLLYRDLVRDRKIAQDVSAFQESTAHPSVFTITATAKPGHSAAELTEAIDADLTKLGSAGPSTADLGAARATVLGDMVRGVEPIGDFDGRADTINRYDFYTGKPDYLQADIARHANVGAADVRAFVTEQLRRDGRVVVNTVPGEKVLPPDPAPGPPPPTTAQTARSAQPWRNAVPKPTPAPTPQLPAVQRFVLGNGMPVYLVASHGLPVVTAAVVSRYGGAADPVGAAGLAQFTVNMLRQGAAGKDAAAIAAAVGALGGQLSSSSHPDSSMVNLQTLTPRAAAGLSLLADLVRHPTFPTDAVARVRDDLRVALTAQASQAATTAYGIMRQQVFGKDHPYGHLATGTRDGLARVDRKQLIGFAAKAYTPATTALVLAGDLTEARARTLAQQAFGSWRGRASAPAVPGPARPAAARVAIVDLPAATQTALDIGQQALTRTDPQFNAAEVGNRVLGALGLSSRLDLNLRQKRGWTYGLFSNLAGMRGRGWFDVSGSVETAHTGESVREVFAEINQIRGHEVTPDELRRAKAAIIGGIPALFGTTPTAAETTAEMFVLGLPLDFYRRLPVRIEAVTASQVRAALSRVLDPALMRVVAVGDRAKIEAQLRTYAGGAPVILDPYGAPAHK